MKKLLIAVLFLGGMTAQAQHVTHLAHNNDRGIRYNQPQSITFIERGVKFVVFTNGEFDFTRTRQGNEYGRRGNGHNAPGHNYGVSYRPGNRGFVKYNRWGTVMKVGRNYVDYNRRGKVNQIGTVSLRYHRGQLVRVGNMEIIYNRRGQIKNLIGYIHHDHAVCDVDGSSVNEFDYYNDHQNHWDNRRNNLDAQGTRLRNKKNHNN